MPEMTTHHRRLPARYLQLLIVSPQRTCVTLPSIWHLQLFGESPDSPIHAPPMICHKCAYWASAFDLLLAAALNNLIAVPTSGDSLPDSLAPSPTTGYIPLAGPPRQLPECRINLRRKLLQMDLCRRQLTVPVQVKRYQILVHSSLTDPEKNPRVPTVWGGDTVIRLLSRKSAIIN